MKEYLSNLIPRLKEFSASLDKQEIFIDKPWVWLDENNDQQKLIFKRNGELIMSVNGKASIAKWEYIKAAKSLLLDRIQDKLLLNQAFIDEAVMILKHDGVKGNKLLFVNEILVPDLDADRYLRELFYRKNSIQISKLTTGENFEVHQVYYQNQTSHKPVTIDLKEVSDGRYITAKGNIAVVKSGLLENFYCHKQQTLKNGSKVIVENPIFNDELFPLNCNVYESDGKTPLRDGKYIFSTFKSFHVLNGRIIRQSLF